MKKLVLILTLALSLNSFIFSQCNSGNYKNILTFSYSWQNTLATGSNQRPYWKFAAIYGNTYEISTCNGVFEDTYIRIYDNSWNLVAYNDDFGPYCLSLNASIMWTCYSTGNYYIFLSHYVCDKLEYNQIVSYKMDSSLPINLIDFNGYCYNNKIYLFWSTASEENSDYFELERSLDAINYFNIVNIQAMGDGNSIQKYKYVDNHVGENMIYYYRLKEVDKNGFFTIYPPIYIDFCKTQIIYNTLYNNSGKVLITFNSNEIINPYNIYKYYPTISSGIYFIESTYNSSNTITQKLIITN